MESLTDNQKASNLLTNAYFLALKRANKGTLTIDENFIELKIFFENPDIKIDLFDQRSNKYDKGLEGALEIFSKEEGGIVLLAQKYLPDANMSKYGKIILGFSIRDYPQDKKLEKKLGKIIFNELNERGSGVFAGILPELICNYNLI